MPSLALPPPVPDNFWTQPYRHEDRETDLVVTYQGYSLVLLILSRDEN